ncbi:uncharacterized protein LOC117316793 [Pecten maximus]|uniref:uncharacterized protein LOC117316793 n=1 Tax=Pecten maximus TaxID=6579 RepID=UPI001459051F|nr:uncharacterized protein LOC117316793 [Pecten maximus]
MLGFHLIALLLTSYIRVSIQHGFLSWPPQRSSLWRHGFDSPINYNDNALWCGGLPYFKQVGQKCGTCGDSYYGPHEHEAGGKYGLGIIGARYPEGTTSLQVTVTVNAYHKGFFEFKICSHNNPLAPVQQECLDQSPLKVREAKKDKDGFKYYPPKGGEIELTVELPKGIHCSQCVLQWKYKTGNSWGKDRDGNSCLGCGAQEQFQNCADISIGFDAPPEQQTFGFTKRSVTVHMGHTKSPRTVSPDQIMDHPRDANTNTLSPSAQYVVHGQNVATISPALPPPPPKVPEKIDINGLTLTGQLQDLLSRQTLSLTNPPSPPLYMTQWTTNRPSKLEPQSRSPKQTGSHQKKRGHSSNTDNLQQKINTHVTSVRKSRWRNVAVHTTKNTGSLFADHNNAGMVISAPGTPVKSLTGKSPSKYEGPTAIPSKIKSANMLLKALTADNKNKPHLKSNGVRKARTKPVKKLTRKQRRRAERLARKQRREAAKKAKKAERLARRRNSQLSSRRRSRRREIKTSSPRMAVSNQDASPQPASNNDVSKKKSVSSHNEKQHPSPVIDATSPKLSSSSKKAKPTSSTLNKILEKLKEKLLGRSSEHVQTTLQSTQTGGSRVSSSIHYSTSKLSPARSQQRYSLPQSTIKNQDRSFLRLVAGLKKAIKMAEKSAAGADVIKSMKDLLNDVAKRNPNLV